MLTGACNPMLSDRCTPSGIQYRAVSITHRDPLSGVGNQMFAMVSPTVTPAELFKFTSLAAPLNGLFIATAPAHDPFIGGLSAGKLGGAIEQENAARYADFINAVLSDQGARFAPSEVTEVLAASVSIFGRCLKLVFTPVRKCGALCFKR